MKLVWFVIFAVIVGFGLFWKREPPARHGGPPESVVVETASDVPAPVGTPSGPPPSPAETPTPAPDELTPKLQKIAELARFTLPTQENRDALIARLSDPALQNSLQEVLRASDHLDYDASQEKLRMNAVSVLGLMLRYKDVSQREDLVRGIRERILSVDFDRMKDIRVKQSVYGDITELLMILKQHDPESFEELAQRISETNRKVLKTALAASR